MTTSTVVHCKGDIRESEGIIECTSGSESIGRKGLCERELLMIQDETDVSVIQEGGLSLAIPPLSTNHNGDYLDPRLVVPPLPAYALALSPFVLSNLVNHFSPLSLLSRPFPTRPILLGSIPPFPYSPHLFPLVLVLLELSECSNLPSSLRQTPRR